MADGELRFHRIRITAQSVDECEGKLALVKIPRDTVTRVRLTHDVIAERPIFLIAAGLVLSTLGIIGAIYLFHGGNLLRIGVSLAFGLVGGPLLIASALKRGPVLRVETSRGTRKLGFGPKITPAELPAFVERAREVTGLTIDI